MTRLTLLRHAKSSWDDPSLSDLQRPLNERGRQAASLMGRVCAEHLPAPDLVILSPSVRTGETVRLFLEAWSRAVSEADSADVRVLDGLYLAGMRDWIRIIDQLASYGGHVVGCGHQPGLGDFASWLDSGFTGTVSTAAVISFPITEGDGLAERGGWKVDYFGRPKDFSS